ncbi:MAG: restriction endonuclease subunit S [Parcubacteria group bacterium]|jgi:type I restriction enzyme S subunit
MIKIQEKINIPQGWEENKLLDCLHVPSKLAGIKLSEYKEEGDFPVFDQGQNYISGYSSKKELLINNVPAILFGDHTRVVKYIKRPFVAGADGTKIFWAKDNFDPAFLYYLILNQKIPNTGYNRHFKFFKDIKVIIPRSKTEQQKIAEILGAVDEDIAKTQNVIEATEKLKKGLMQELFTRGIGHNKFKKTKLGEIPEEWETTTIKNSSIELIDGDRGANYPKQKDFSLDGYCLFLSAKNVSKNGFVFNETSFISQKKDNILRKGKLKRGDIILTSRGTVGNVAYYSENIPFENIRINSGMLIIRHGKQFDPIFLYKYFSSPQMKSKYLSMGSGSAQPQLPVGSFELTEIPILPIVEQQRIAEILSAVDEKINVNKKLKIKLTKLKKGLMQDLLSGEVRV